MKRRKFIITSAQAGTAALLGFSLSKCKESDPCDDLSSLTPEQIEERKGYNYNKESPYPTKKCINCEFWLEPEEGSSCGSCGLFEGPVHVNGYCDQWVLNES
jgi:High potential iron-sulfur protein